MKAREAIDAMGGLTKVAKLAGTTVQAVWNWGDVDKFPPDRLFPLKRGLKKAGIVLSHSELCTLFGMLE